MGDVVTATEFLFTLVTEIILTLYVLTYAMHCLLVVVRDTADGNDEVIWPSEPFQDWVGGSLHLVVVVVAWLAPVGMLARALRQTWLPEQDALRFLILAVPGLWLFFPVALFSSLSGSSRWFLFRPVVVWNLLRVPPSTFAFYVLSALLAAGVAALAYFAIVGGWVLLVPVAAAGAAAAFLIYARLLGRLAWRMGQLPSGKRKATKAPVPVKGLKVEVQDPWAVPDDPEEPAPLPETEETPYGQKRQRVKGYGLAPQEPVKEKVPEKAPQPEKPAKERPKRTAAPRRKLVGGVLTFPGYTRSRRAWLLLSLGLLALGVGAWALVQLYMTLFKEG